VGFPSSQSKSKVNSMAKQAAEKDKDKEKQKAKPAPSGGEKPKKEKAKPAETSEAAAPKEKGKDKDKEKDKEKEKAKPAPRPPADPRLKVLKKFYGKFLPRGPLRDRHKALMQRWNSGDDHGGVTLEELKSLLNDWKTARERRGRLAGTSK
jgi:hypothetical protein